MQPCKIIYILQKIDVKQLFLCEETDVTEIIETKHSYSIQLSCYDFYCKSLKLQ